MRKKALNPERKFNFFLKAYISSPSKKKTKIKQFRVNKWYKKVVGQV